MIYLLNPLPHRITQQPDLCCAAMVATEAQRRGLDYGGSLENFAVKLGLHVNEKNAYMYGGNLRKRALPDGDAGIGLLFNDFKKQEFLKRLEDRIGLKATAYSLSEITGDDPLKNRLYDIDNAREKMGDFIKIHLSDNKGVGMNFRLEPLTGREDGHYALAFAFNQRKNKIYVSDTSPFSPEPGYYYNLDRFIFGMMPIHKEDDGAIRERGVIVFDGPILQEKIEDEDLVKMLKEVPEYVPVNARVKVFPSHPHLRTRPYSPLPSTQPTEK